jgi:hypothetical protein
MKTVYIILTLFLFGAASAHSQTLKALSYNTTNGGIVYSGTNDLRMPATFRIGTNQSGFSSFSVGSSQFLQLWDGAGAVAMLVSTSAITFYDPLAFSLTAHAATTRTNLGATSVGNTVFTASNAATAATAIGLGTTNSPTFSNLTLNGTLGVSNAATFATNVSVNGTFVFASSSVPTATTNAGVKGQLAYTNNYLYICISNNTWRRVLLETW